MSLLHRLNTEWETVLALEDIPLPWYSQVPELGACLNLGDVLALVPTWPEPILRGLIHLAQTQADATATRVVLQAMIPKLVLMSSSGIARSRPDSFDDLATSMVGQIAAVPLRRSSAIAGNLALDTLRDAQSLWRTSTPDREVATEAIEPLLARAHPILAHDDSPTATEVLAAAATHGWLSPAMHDLMTAYYSQGLTSVELADLHSCQPATIRSRCRNAVNTLRKHQEALAAA